ncbi:MAG: tRNA (guanosine(37)-N1)-methyltransferase TrmD [Halothiobacillus sp.]|jgi:tRNA (guanine37-N1)-methyltransferase|nr:tRNA (guanosine(37)-N1)-methyltransferase TrmD [Halothiobacillus sp.]
MRVTVVTLFPELVAAVGDSGIPRVAMESGALQVDTISPRDFAVNRHRTVDDRPFGGGPGMLMIPETLAAAISAAKKRTIGARVLLMSPQGRRLDRAAVHALADEAALILVCGRYEGIDQRVIDTLVDEQVSIGDYVLSGGELGAMVVIDAIARRLPGVLGDAESVVQDSFEAQLLDHPHYTRPDVWQGMAVPDVLRSGDHRAIEAWRELQRLCVTATARPDLFYQRGLDERARALLTAEWLHSAATNV